VDDASTDDTFVVAQALAARCPGVRVVQHAANGGIGRAFKTGVENACGAWLILIPADLALQPRELAKYLEAARGADIVVGNRSNVDDYSFFRRLVHYANIGLIRLLFGMPLRQFQYISLYRLAVLRQMDIEFTGSAFVLAEILIKARALGARLVEVPIEYLPRASGQATGARWKLVAATVRDLLTFWWRWVRLGPVAASRRRGVIP
jgi:glycosyltransferase involved in cell wall biosynthesis